MGVGAAALAAAVSITPAPVGAATPKIIVGAVGDASGLGKSTIGSPLAYHGYGKLNGGVPVAKMISVRPVTTWRSVANAGSGTSTYNDIVRWAQAIKGRSGTILLAFSHEPEASTNTNLGSAGDFIAAYRRVVDIFRQQGVANVEYTWQMTSWAFAVNSGDRRAAAKWYPGDAYVNNVGTDPYNWYRCRDSSGSWKELKQVMDPSLAFARAHGKKLVVAEFGSVADSRRPQWLRNAHQYFVANRDTVRAVFYFQYPAAQGCPWTLNTSGDMAAMKELAGDSTNFSTS